MKLLWFTNSLMLPVAEYLNRPSEILAGWMWALASRLAARSDIELAIATSAPGASAQVSLGGIRYYVLSQPKGRNYLPHSNDDLKQALAAIRDFDPDLIHIHGTERFYGLVASRRRDVPTVVSIQGLLSQCLKYEFAGIGIADRLRVLRLRDLIRLKGPVFETWAMRRAARRELEIIRGNYHLIGRTDWDRAWVEAINPSATYHSCNEILRGPFFERTWSLKKIRRHSLVITHTMFPRKGVPILLDALAILRRTHPDVHVTLAGYWHPVSGWGRMIAGKIRALKIGSNVTFAGALAAEDLAALLETTHVFVSPSFIENSSNSISEAMVVGTPCVASFVGGVPSLMTHGTSGVMVPAGDPALLANSVRRVFEDDRLASRISSEARATARERHDPAAIVRRQMEIYSQILRGDGLEPVSTASAVFQASEFHL